LLVLAGSLVLALAACQAERAEPAEPVEGIGEFVEVGFPFIVSTVDLRTLGPAFAPDNVATRGVVLMLGNDSYAVFDPDLLRMAVGWRGGFLDLVTMAQISYRETGNKDNRIPKILGDPVFTTGIYPGWSDGAVRFDDPREPGPNPADVGRGPVPVELGRWNGIHVVGDRAVLSYAVQGVQVYEEPSSLREGDEVGIARTFRVERTSAPLTLVVAEVGEALDVHAEVESVRLLQGGDTVTVMGVAGAPGGAQLRVVDGRYVTLEVPASRRASEFRVVAWRGPAAAEGAVSAMLAQPVRMVRFDRGGPRHWDTFVRTRGEVSPDTAAYVVDRLTLPFPNPWQRNVRVADAAFFRDGRRAAVVTFEGDVWIVSGIDRGLERLEWRRFASGLYEPLGIEVVDEQIYVHSREGIVRLHDRNRNGEADFYENFTNLVAQSIESREFPLGFAARPGGGFYLGRGGALDMGPRTAAPIMPGFRAGSRHSGSVLEVSADGRELRTFASGLREPFIGVHPESGIVTASDQEGHFVPATPIYLVPRGGYHGVPATAHRDDVPPETPPILWIPHSVDQSGASQVWVTGDPMGFGGDALIHLSYGRPAAFRVFVDSTAAGVQGALVPLLNDFPAPLLNGVFNERDASLYLTGFQIWGSRARELSVLARVRYTGQPSPLPVAVRAAAPGVVIRFGVPLDPGAVSDVTRFTVKRWNYRRTQAYGSGHFLLDGSPGQETLPVAAAHLSEDRHSVLLVIPDMQPVKQMEVGYSLPAADGRTLSDVVYLTVHRAKEIDLAANGFGRVDWRADLVRAGDRPVAAAPAEAATAQRGAQIFQDIGCVACHSTDGSSAGRLGPTMRGLFGALRPLEDGTSRRADAAYLRESIVDPAAAIVRGYPNSMPSYLGVLSDDEVESVVLYIQSLGGAGQ
jgi:mono/diheme cytochrome c family protein